MSTYRSRPLRRAIWISVLNAVLMIVLATVVAISFVGIGLVALGVMFG